MKNHEYFSDLLLKLEAIEKDNYTRWAIFRKHEGLEEADAVLKAVVFLVRKIKERSIDQ